MSHTLYSDRGLSLRRLYPDADFFGDDVAAASCCEDSRACRSGDVFVAMIGPRHDGHDFVEEAVANGAKAIIAERPLPLAGVPVCVVADSRVAFGVLCQALAGNPSRELKVIGVTGTRGKTSTACLIAGMLETAGLSVGLLNTIGYCDGQDFVAAAKTTPSAAGLAHWLARMKDNGCTHAVVEVSQKALLRSDVAGVRFDTVCLTNLRDGLARGTRLRLFDHLAPEGLAVLNVDDPIGADFAQRVQHPVLTISLDGEAEISATLLERCRSEQTILLTAGSESIALRTTIVGDHHIRNCLVAAAIGLAQGLELTTIVRGLESVKRIPGRLERIECGQPFGVFLDFADSPESLQGSLDTLREVTSGRLVCVLASGGKKDAARAEELVRTAQTLADQVIQATNQRVFRMPYGRDQTTTAPIRRMSELESAIPWGLNEARPGDTVLIVGDGQRQADPMAGEANERDIAREWLYRQAAFLGSPVCS